MKLRIVGGTLRGRLIRLSGRVEDFRPTLDRTREAVASSIQDRINGAVVADLCAGSGAFGFEMISRGAARVDFVEVDHQRGKMIMETARQLMVEGKCRLFAEDVRSFLGRESQYDIIYFDPPYDDADLQALIPSVIAHVAPRGVLVAERRRDAVRPGDVPRPCKIRNYGGCSVEYFSPDAH